MQLTDTLAVKVLKAGTSVVWDVNHTDTHTHTGRLHKRQIHPRAKKIEMSSDMSIDYFKDGDHIKDVYLFIKFLTAAD